jgi:hypothetical protein
MTRGSMAAILSCAPNFHMCAFILRLFLLNAKERSSFFLCRKPILTVENTKLLYY